MVPPSSNRISRVPPYSPQQINLILRIRGFHPLPPIFPNRSATLDLSSAVSAPSISLATTLEISFDFFSCGYLDVSVLRVRLDNVTTIDARLSPGGSPHSDIHGSSLVRQLPVAFRRPLRLSSPSTA